MLPYATDLDENNLHVQAPSDVIFLCGGPTSGVANTTPPKSLRDAFLKIIDLKVIKNKDIIQAEDVTSEMFFFGRYKDVLAFETDLAQITELILLFCESAGSFAELGAFSMIPDISERLLVVVQDYFWKENSFIKLGPLLYLERKYGPTSVFVIDDSDTGMHGTDVSKLDKGALKKLIEEPLRAYFDRPREPTTFDRNKAGHIMKLIVGLIQDYGALNTPEIIDILSVFSVTISEDLLGSYMLCAKAVGWIVERRKGSNNLYVAVDLKDAANFRLKADASSKNKIRRRLDIMEYWRTKDPQRHALIIDYRAEFAK